MVEAITFDFWNTLYKGPPDAVVSEQRARDVQSVFKSEGFYFSLEELSIAFKSAWREAYYSQRVLGRDPGPKGQVDHVMKVLGVDRLKQPKMLYEAYASTLLKLPPEINDGVMEVLTNLQGRFKLAVICNTGATPGVYLRKIMEADKLCGYFSYLFFSDELGCAKPNPGIFHLALDKLGTPSTSAMHIGDDAITDVIGAKKSGMKAVWLAPKADWPLPEADYHIKAVGELLSLV